MLRAGRLLRRPAWRGTPQLNPRATRCESHSSACGTVARWSRSAMSTPRLSQRQQPGCPGPAALRITQLLDWQAINAMLIATPVDTHKTMAVGSPDSGKHVYSEKRMALTPEECRVTYRHDRERHLPRPVSNYATIRTGTPRSISSIAEAPARFSSARVVGQLEPLFQRVRMRPPVSVEPETVGAAIVLG